MGIATALGFVLTLGGQNQYAIYSAFTAALVVGTSVGEDLATSVSRVKGTLVGMISGMVVAALVPPSFLTIGAAAALTALIALLFGWGVPVARIGVTICVITLAWHSADAVHYDFYRAVNTSIGIVAGLAVTLFVWPVRARIELERTTQQVLAACRALLDALARGEQQLRPLQGKLHDHLAAVVKAGRDAKREKQAGHPSNVDEARVVEVIRLGVDVLSAALGTPSTDALRSLQQRIDSLEMHSPAA